jgi:hypothetical protein
MTTSERLKRYEEWLRKELSEHSSRCLDDEADVNAVAKALAVRLDSLFVLRHGDEYKGADHE